MIKTLKRIISQDKERFLVPKGVQQTIPIRAIWPDGIFFGWHEIFQVVSL
ncbi:hypothetical protein [Cohnella rhizosphaerae]|uniref:Uncharacterized protein n=1 Tax=Cohnella rhizosphaerae TaxID=1457232 RepID=A0A9X4KSZ1_9BACL|nr:hypothetical protein [Cohnella rhizosphaerae]